MAIKLHKQPPIAAPRVVIYGPPGVGKTTFACGAPSPVLLPFEDGIGVNTVPVLTTEGSRTIANVADLESAIGGLIEQEHEFKSVIVDSLTALQTILADHVAREASKGSIDEIPYGKGWSSLISMWNQTLRGLDTLREKRGMAIICIAHASTSTYEDPETSPYERTEMRLQHSKNTSVRATTREWADMVLFADLRKTVTKVGKGSDERVRAIDGRGERVLKTKPSAARDGKDRYNLPAELPLTWAAFEEAYRASTNIITTNQATNTP